jgi:prophage antirepressor-like protein
MSDLSIFTFEEQEIRFVGTEEKPEWIASDIVAVLYPSAARSSYSKYLGKVPSQWKGKKQILTPGGKQKLTTLYEPGLYCLIERTNILLKDRVRNILLDKELQATLKPATAEPKRLEYPVSDRAITLGYKPSNSQLQQIGK